MAGCANCGHHHIAYNSCKNRHCPKCQGPAARDWMAARAEDLLPVEYFHVVFTLPAEIAQIAFWNKKAIYDLLFRASAQTVMTIAADPKRLGARIGMTAVLHTSCRRRVFDTTGSALTHHPHIHMIVGARTARVGKPPKEEAAGAVALPVGKERNRWRPRSYPTNAQGVMAAVTRSFRQLMSVQSARDGCVPSPFPADCAVQGNRTRPSA